MPLIENELQFQALRGATTCKNNSIEAIEVAVTELIRELVSRNKLVPNRIVSLTFSVTNDLNACFPAAIARREEGWEDVSLLDCQQMAVEGDLDYCIRILAHVLIPKNQKPMHTYLGNARSLRPDRAN